MTKNKVLPVLLSLTMALAMLGGLPTIAYAANPPDIVIDYVREQFSESTANPQGYYIIAAGDSVYEKKLQADAFGQVSITDDMMAGLVLSIEETDSEFNVSTITSSPGTIFIPGRGMAPSGQTKANETAPGANDGTIKNVNTNMEWTNNLNTPAGEWQACTGTSIEGLAPGTYYLRYQADQAAEQFASAYTAITVLEFGTLVCGISGGAQYDSFEEAYFSATNGDTIYLLADCNMYLSIELWEDLNTLTIDLRGYRLDVENGIIVTAGSNLSITNGGSIKTETFIIDGGTLSANCDIYSDDYGFIAFNKATVNVTGNIYAGYIGLQAYLEANVKVIGNITAEDADGVDAFEGAIISVVGDITAGDDAVSAFDKGTKVTVQGNTHSLYGIYSGEGAIVYLEGDIYSVITGVYTMLGAETFVNGDISFESDFGIIAFTDAIIRVTGSIVALSEDSIGVISGRGTQVTIDGAITADRFIVFFDYGEIMDEFIEIEKAAEDFDPISQKSGYLQYSYSYGEDLDPAYVWVKLYSSDGEGNEVGTGESNEVGIGESTTTPYTGDIALVLSSIICLSLVFGTTSLMLARRRQN